MTLDDLNLLVDYNYWARERLLDAVSALTPEHSKTNRVDILGRNHDGHLFRA